MRVTTLNILDVQIRSGVDPSFEKMEKDVKQYCVCTTSDIFFANIPDDLLFDCIFIDGDHSYEQVVKDIRNSKKHLSANGVIIMHDVFTNSEFATVPFWPDTNYNGTVYQAFFEEVMMNEIKHTYNVYYTGIDATGIIDTDTSYTVDKTDNLLAKYKNIIKEYLDIQGTTIDLDNDDIFYAVVSIYRLGYPDYAKYKSWLYPYYDVKKIAHSK